MAKSFSRPTSEDLRVSRDLHGIFSGTASFWTSVLMKMYGLYGRDFVLRSVTELLQGKGRLQADGIAPYRFACPLEFCDTAKPSKADKPAWAVFRVGRQEWRKNVMVRCTVWLLQRKNRLEPDVAAFDSEAEIAPGLASAHVPSMREREITPGRHRIERTL